MKKAHSRTSLSNVHSETQKLRRQNANVPASAKSVLPSFYWFRMLSWIRNFLATNCKGYDHSRLSDDIHRGSRQIHDKWLRFTCHSCTLSQNRLAMKTSVKPLQNIFTLVLYEVVIEISTALCSVCRHKTPLFTDSFVYPKETLLQWLTPFIQTPVNNDIDIFSHFYPTPTQCYNTGYGRSLMIYLFFRGRRMLQEKITSPKKNGNGKTQGSVGPRFNILK